MMRRFLWMTAFGFALCSVTGLLWESSPVTLAGQTDEAVSQQSRGASVSVIDVEAREHLGSLLQLETEKLVLGGSAQQSFDTSDLISLQFPGHVSSKLQPSAVIYLANGDRLYANPLKIQDEHLIARWIRHPSWPLLRLPLETIRGIVFRLPTVATARHGITKLLLDRHESNDIVVLYNGDQVSGEFVSLDAENLQLEGPVGTTTVERSNVRAVGFNADLIAFPTEDGQRALVTLIDGSRLSVRNLQLRNDESLSAKALYGETITLPTSALAAIQFLGGRAVYLSELKPAEYQFTPFLSEQWPMRTNRNAAGGPLRLHGTEYARGIGLHSRSRLSYRLDGVYRRFQATVGIDDVTAGAGSVVFGVEVDGKRVFTSDVQTGKSQSVEIGPFDLSGKQQLTLLVDYGPFGDIYDHANWCNALLLK